MQFTPQELQWLYGAINRIQFTGQEAESVVSIKQKIEKLVKDSVVEPKEVKKKEL